MVPLETKLKANQCTKIGAMVSRDETRRRRGSAFLALILRLSVSYWYRGAVR